MAQSFPETAHLKTDKKKYEENFDRIDWGNLKDKPLPPPAPAKHKTAGLCGEFGLSVFDEKAYKENFDRIRWEPERMATEEEMNQLTKELSSES